MIGEIIRWWGQQLLSLIPGVVRAGEGNAVLATQRGASIDVHVRRRGKVGGLGAFPLTGSGAAALAAALGARRAPLALTLPAGAVLEQVVALPLAAERDPEQVLRYEMDRLTPFAVDKLYWTWAVERRDRVQGQLQVRLSLVLRSQVDGVLETLRGAGLQLASLVSDGGRVIPLDAARTGVWRQRAGAVLGAICALLAVAAVSLPFVEQARVAGRVEERIADLRPAVAQAEALRRGLSLAAAGVDVLATQRARLGDPLATLAALTDILPDDTTLTDLTMRARVITFAGQSGAAARLISALAADPAIRDPAFTAPVTRNETQRADLFSIRAEASAP